MPKAAFIGKILVGEGHSPLSFSFVYVEGSGSGQRQENHSLQIILALISQKETISSVVTWSS